MSTGVRLAAFVTGLVLLGTASYAVGRATGPVGPSAPASDMHGHR